MHPGDPLGWSADASSFLAAIVQSADDAIFSKDSNAVLTSWNPAAERLYGYTAEEAIGQSVRILIPPSRVGEERVILDRILADESVEHYETERVTKDGQIVHVSITASPIHDKHGGVIGASVIARDIRERRRFVEMEKELERKEFVNVVAHELRGPLAAIAGASHFLAEDPGAVRDDRKPLVEILTRQTAHLQELIKDLLDLSRLESGRFTVTLQDVSLDEVVETAVASVPVPEEKTISVDVDGLRVMADPFRLQQILTNLITNAYKYGGEQVTLTAKLIDNAIELCVTDNGAGLTLDDIEDAFEPFVRGKEARASGSGLGLAITRGLAEAMGGSIRYEEASPHGASFTCSLLAPIPSRK